MPGSPSGSAAGGAGNHPEPNCLTRRAMAVTTRFHGVLDRFFEGLAGLVWRRPCLVLALTTLLALGCSAGLMWRNEESSGEVIWVPQGSPSKARQELLDDVWAQDVTALTVITEPRAAGSSVLTQAILAEQFALHARVQALSVDGGATTAENLCIRNPLPPGAPPGTQPECAFFGPLSWWDYNATRVAADTDLAATVRAEGDLERPFGTKLPFGSVFATDDASGRIVATQSVWPWSNNDVDRRMALEQAFLDMMADVVAASEAALDAADVDAAFAADPDAILRYSTVAYSAQRTIDDELGRAVSDDIGLFGLAIIVMFAYSAFALSRWDPHNTKFLVAAMGTLSVLLAIGMSFGICSATQLYFTSLTGILPFLLVGIGVDDMFVMVDAIYYRRGWPTAAQLALVDDKERDGMLRRRFAAGMAEAGAAITITSVTNACAFFLGAFTSIPAVQAFCVFAGAGVLCDFLLQVTFFAAYVVIDIRRRAAERIELLPCVVRHRAAASAGSDADDAGSSDGGQELDDAAAPKKPAFVDDDSTIEPEPSPVRRALGAYGRILTKKPVSATVLLLFTGVTAAAVYGATNIEQGLPLTDLVPPDSYYRSFDNRLTALFNGFGGTYYIAHGNEDEELDYASLEIQVAWEALTRDVEVSKTTYGDESLTTSWQRALASYVAAVAPADLVCPASGPASNCTASCPREAGGCVAPARYWTHLEDFLALPTARVFRDGFVARVGGDAAPVTGPASIRATRIAVPNAGVGDAKQRTEALAFFHDLTEEWQDELPGAFVHTRFFIFVESDLVQLQETVVTLALALVAVLVVSSVMLVHPILSPVVGLCILMIDAWLFGFMSLVDVRFNALAVTNLVMSVGLSADFVAHVAHGYICGAPNSADRAEKVVAALTSLGVPVLHGAATTFLGVLLLSFASSTPFQIFFKMMVGVVISSLLFALVFLPALLRFVGPTVYLHEGAEHERGDNKDAEDGYSTGSSTEDGA